MAALNLVESKFSAPVFWSVVIPNWDSTVSLSPLPVSASGPRMAARIERGIESPVSAAAMVGLPSSSSDGLVSEEIALATAL
ncbi:hypothetical protein D3C73_1223500 [compost metagenome]